ncbi:universal stress protein Sll1388-like [Ruditapes philippinarum]|uniref:universal stress protein Sll1388-like n=1 Tax=Ruditapes philippinarum TaxID=129788 RepID=UPI00295C1E05|nr:universal stress protein Sll1388-like [Ruditapes philippinarum]
MDVVKRGSDRRRRIVIGFDGSKSAEDAFRWFVTKVHQKGDYVIVIYIPEFKKLTHVPVMTADAALMTKIITEEQNQNRLLMAQMNELMKLSNVKGTVKQLTGEPGEQLVLAARKEGADFIVTGSRGLGTLRRTFLGSVSDYVVHHATVPVVVCRLDDYVL